MIIVTVVVTTKPEFTDRFIAQMNGLAVTVRSEEGCLAYDLYADPSQADRLFLFEKWASKAALEQHFAQPHMAEHFNLVADWFAGETIMTTYDVAGEQRQVV